jgi:hypothetical protein
MDKVIVTVIALHNGFAHLSSETIEASQPRIGMLVTAKAAEMADAAYANGAESIASAYWQYDWEQALPYPQNQKCGVIDLSVLPGAQEVV